MNSLHNEIVGSYNSDCEPCNFHNIAGFNIVEQVS